MFETHSRHEPKEMNELEHSSGRQQYKGNFPGTSIEDKIKNILIKNTESYDGVGERMIQIVKELLKLLQELSQSDSDLVYDAISRVLVEFIATQPFKTGIFAGVTALFLTSLTNDSPLSTHSNLTTRIFELLTKRFTSDLSKSNYYSCQLILNYITEMANFYIIDLNQLVSIYRIILNKSLSLKKSRSNSSLKYLVSDHNSFILFTLIAYSLPLIREELRNSESESHHQVLYNEILKDITLFYDTYLVEYCEETQKVMLNLVQKDLLEAHTVENPFSKYWNSFLRWKNQQCPRIMTILRFYRSPSISDYLSEILSPLNFNFEEALSNLELGEVNEYLSKQLIRFPSINTLEIGEFMLLRTMDSINEIFVQSPYETARQLLKLPVTSSSYDLCLSITIWNYLFNPFYVSHLSFVNSLVLNLIRLQSSFLVTIWTPIFILNMQPCKDLINVNSPRSKEMIDSEIDPGNESQKQNCTIEDSNNPIIGGMVNHLVFPHFRTLSMGMLLRLKKHIICVLSSNDIFQNPSLSESFWNSDKTEFLFKTEIQDTFLSGFLDSVLTGMSRLMLPQTLMSISNENLNLRMNKISFLSKDTPKTTLPTLFFKLKEFNYLKEILVFKFTTKDEITEKNNLITQFLKSKLDKPNDHDENKDDLDEDLQVSERYEERQYHKEDSKDEETSNNEDQGGNPSKEMFKSSKKRRINSILPQDQFTWTKDSLFDLLLISIIDQGSKSPSHTKRLFANYKAALLGWYGDERNELEEFNENESKNTALSGTQNHFSDQVGQITNGILNYEIFKDFTKRLLSNGDNNSASELNSILINHSNIKTEIRLLSVILTIWGGFSSGDPSICMGFNFQKLKTLVMITIDEGILSPALASIGLACILTCIQIPPLLDISLIKSRYQIYFDLFELIIEILDGVKAKETIIESSEPVNSNESEMDDKKHSSNVFSSNTMKMCVLSLIGILMSGSKICDDRKVEDKLIKLLEDSSAEIFLRFGSSLINSGENFGMNLESIQEFTHGEFMAQLVKDINNLSLEYILNYNDPALKLEQRWVSSSVINRS